MSRILVACLGLVLSAVPLSATGETATDPAAWRSKVDPWVFEQSQRESSFEYLVVLAEQADLSAAARLSNKEAKGRYVFETLRRKAAETQGGVLAELKDRGVAHRSYWVANMIWVRSDLATVEAMAQRPEVLRVSANPSVALELPRVDAAPRPDAAPNGIEWNISKVKAPDYWTEGYDGTGIVVAGQDTGYDWDHPALIDQYRGWNGATASHAYNWHDAIHSGGGVCGADSAEPCDDNNHGTHTMGTMVGDDGAGNQIGVAPGARWIGCRNMDRGNGTPTTYAECFQWFIAPTDLAGLNPDPAMAPHVINNSWGCPPSEGCTDPNVLRTVVENTRAAGIVVVASAGNYGSSCSTVQDPPATYAAAFSVGSTTSSDNASSFSSRGPVTVDASGRMKPDIAAPGSSIRSSVRGGSYQSGWSGTSMAGPHVAGQVALLIHQAPSLEGQVDAIEACIRATAAPLTTSQGCGGDGPTAVPNNVFGHGRIEMAWPPPAACSPQGLFRDGFETGNTSGWSGSGSS